ncbi:hypothetical protein HFO21_32820 [Rhizobium laguerreae]|uniref:hypothetical protein n=1 Tax=Rhizobium laguerreae TaxID=1076926 RepID=UPI001C923697|nr:hypothetical protein [Rhizobium laguerreae]MBY3219092.1 hypothetical protein [Rhizobium laguerreae]
MIKNWFESCVFRHPTNVSVKGTRCRLRDLPKEDLSVLEKDQIRISAILTNEIYIQEKMMGTDC